MQEKIVLIGAGSAMFTRGLAADLIKSGWDARLCLVDTDPQALKVAEGLVQKMIQAKNAPIKLFAFTDRRQALESATAVICTIGVGGRRAWEQDVFIPRKYGIYQPVGDSVAPGGTSRALRMIPPMVEIAKDILDLAPNALFFNYGNPMGPICRAVRKATGANVVGLCHGVNGVAQYLASVLGAADHRLKYTAVGMNHLTWFTDVRVDGTTAMPKLMSFADEVLSRISFDEAGAHFAKAGDKETEKGIGYPFSWQLLKIFQAFPAVLDRHVTEFFPQFFGSNEYFGKKLGVDAFSFERTIANGDKIFAQMQEQALSNEPLPQRYFEQFGGEHEQVIQIIDSIRKDAGRIYSANLPNHGQLPDFPLHAILEAPAIADAAGVRHIAQAPLPSSITGTLATRLSWVETVVDAALEGSRQKFIQALILDGWVSSIKTATDMADELLEAQSRYLPDFSVAWRDR